MDQSPHLQLLIAHLADIRATAEALGRALSRAEARVELFGVTADPACLTEIANCLEHIGRDSLVMHQVAAEAGTPLSVIAADADAAQAT